MFDFGLLSKEPFWPLQLILACSTQPHYQGPNQIILTRDTRPGQAGRQAAGLGAKDSLHFEMHIKQVK